MELYTSLSQWILVLTLLQPVIALDMVSSGNYLIHLCNSGQPNSYASKLQALLPRVYNGLENVIADLTLGTASSHGYKAFFKDDSSKSEVSLVYKKMAAGASIAVGEVLRNPTFMCAQNVPETELFYHYCIEGSAALMTWYRTEITPVCPQFWSVKGKSGLSDCPLVVGNTLTPNDDRLLANQEALIVGGLVHLYHDVYHDFVTNITDVLELSASDSLLNPTNYALYYSAVQAGCMSFPDMSKPHGGFRRLQEVPNNSSITDINVPFYSEIPSSVTVPPALDILQDFCNGAVYAPNATVCCDEATGLWKPAPVIRDGPVAHSISASCPQNTGGTGGVGAGSGIIHFRRRRTDNAQ